MMGWPRPRDRLSATSRAITSLALPGPLGTMSLIGRDGQLCAPALVANPSSSAPSRATIRITLFPHLEAELAHGAAERIAFVDQERTHVLIPARLDALLAQRLAGFGIVEG